MLATKFVLRCNYMIFVKSTKHDKAVSLSLGHSISSFPRLSIMVILGQSRILIYFINSNLVVCVFKFGYE